MPAHYLAQPLASRFFALFAFFPSSAAIALALLAPLTTTACGGPQTDVQTSTGAASPTDSTNAEEPTESTEEPALLDVLADRETEILLDGKKIGTTPISAHKVTPGTHDVTFVDERNGNRTMTVTIAAGEAKTVKSDLPPQLQEQGSGGKK
jgi:hypothetical protein